MVKRMPALRKSVVAASFLLALAGGAYAASDWLTGSTEQRLKTLASIQPGLGTVMIECGNRYSDIYYAAKAGNWPLAAYQLKEMREIQEVGETTRPGRAAGLKAFEQSFLDPGQNHRGEGSPGFRDGIQGRHSGLRPLSCRARFSLHQIRTAQQPSVPTRHEALSVSAP